MGKPKVSAEDKVLAYFSNAPFGEAKRVLTSAILILNARILTDTKAAPKAKVVYEEYTPPKIGPYTTDSGA